MERFGWAGRRKDLLLSYSPSCPNLTPKVSLLQDIDRGVKLLYAVKIFSKMVINKIVLIEAGAPAAHFFSYARVPRLGLPLLGAILKKLGYQVKIFCEDFASINWKEVFSADLIGISSLTCSATRAYQILNKIKKVASQIRKNIPVIMGGPHVSFLAEEALRQGADFVIRGEGEKTLVEVIKYLEGTGEKDASQILGLSYRQGEEILHNPPRPPLPSAELDNLPFPDLTSIEGWEKINYIPVQTARGCPYNCKFCSVVKMFGRGYRFRSIEGVVEELKRLFKILPRRRLFFYDDNFSADPERTKKLLELMLKEKAVPSAWIAQERAEVSQDKELLKVMKQSNCSTLCIGFESINQETLRAYRKGIKVTDIEHAIEELHRHQIKIHGMFVFGGEADNPETIKKTVKFSLQHKIDSVQYAILTPAPGTDTYRELDEQGRIFFKGVKHWHRYDGHHVVFEPKLMSPWELQIATLEALKKFYSHWRGFTSLLKGRFSELFLNFYGRHVIEKWIKQNREFLEELKRKITRPQLSLEE